MKQILYNRPTTQWLHIFISHIQSPSLRGSLRKSTSWQESNTSQKLNKSRAQQPRWQLPVPSVNLPCLEPARVCPGSHSNPWWWRALPLLSNCSHGRPGCRGCCRPWGCLSAGFAEPPLDPIPRDETLGFYQISPGSLHLTWSFFPAYRASRRPVYCPAGRPRIQCRSQNSTPTPVFCSTSVYHVDLQFWHFDPCRQGLYPSPAGWRGWCPIGR